MMLLTRMAATKLQAAACGNYHKCGRDIGINNVGIQMIYRHMCWSRDSTDNRFKLFGAL